MMNRGNDRTETLNGIMGREIEKNPHDLPPENRSSFYVRILF
jgi:hypothetical protein